MSGRDHAEVMVIAMVMVTMMVIIIVIALVMMAIPLVSATFSISPQNRGHCQTPVGDGYQDIDSSSDDGLTYRGDRAKDG